MNSNPLPQPRRALILIFSLLAALFGLRGIQARLEARLANQHQLLLGGGSPGPSNMRTRKATQSDVHQA